MTTRLILVSHALTDWNLDGLIQGHTNVPLNRLGHKMARQLAAHLSDEPLDAIYSSDLKRACQTAYPTAESKSLNVFADSGLREVRTFCQVRSPIHPTLPFESEIETRQMALNRFKRTLTRLAQSHDQQTVLVVTHAGILQIFLVQIAAKNDSHPFTEGIRMALNRIDYNSGAWQCLDLNKDILFT